MVIQAFPPILPHSEPFRIVYRMIFREVEFVQFLPYRTDEACLNLLHLFRTSRLRVESKQNKPHSLSAIRFRSESFLCKYWLQELLL